MVRRSVVGCLVAALFACGATGVTVQDGGTPDVDGGSDGGPSPVSDASVDASGHPDGGTTGRALGAFIGETNQRFPTMPGALPYYANEVGRAPAVVLWFAYLGKPFDATSFDAVHAAGSVPMITLQPGGSLPTPNLFPLTALARGDFDSSHLIPWADAARAWGHPFFLRFAHEMNSARTYPWGTAPGNPNLNTPADYVAAWRHVHDVFAAQNVTNAKWVFCPEEGAGALIAENYPGDAYVDWLCFDAYNRGTAGNVGWRSMLQTMKQTYDAVAALSPSKPIVVGETSSVEDGGDKAQWITQGLLQDIPAQLPRIRIFLWFDAIHTDPMGVTHDWEIASSPAALTAYKSVVASPMWQGTAF